MKTFRFISTLVVGLFTTTIALGQVPPLVNYQGRVVVGTTNFDGTGQFKFALVNNNGSVTFWSNDGTSSAGSQPTAPISLPVVKGLYSILLGDTTIAGMPTALPVTVFTNSDVRLRVWFNDGVTGFQQFTPDQRIAAVGYALMGANVPDGAITSNKLANGAVTGSKIADFAITSSKLAPNTVTSSNIADTIALGQTNVNGRLDVYRTTAGTPAITLSGATSAISTFGSDGQEQVRLHGTSYGELLLNNSLANNATAVRLTAQGSSGGQLEMRNTNGSNRALLEGENTGGRLTLYQADGNTGTILYGNDGNGSGALSLKKTNGATGLNLYGGPASGSLSLYNNAGDLNVSAYSYGGEEGVVSVRNSVGSETIYLWGRDSSGLGDGQIGIKKASGVETVTIQAGEGSAAAGPQMIMRNSSGVQTIQLDGDASGVRCGYLALYRSNGVATVIMDADGSGDGRVTTQVLQITGGSDLSENFDIKSHHQPLQPGMIVCIDPKNPGQLVTSSRAYDKTVAGVISGAGGVKPGMLMGQKGTQADGAHPVALTGRVYCMVDADKGAIEPGDLVTTSETPGHGMKVKNHGKAQGAIVGKAMTALEKGKGLVLVLVSLQ